jgi:hypothetical protein
MARERGIAIAVALALHGLALAAAFALAPQRAASAFRPARDFAVRLLHFPQAAARPPPGPSRRGLSLAPAPSAAVTAELIVPEREIIDQGHGVTMTIEGGSAADAGVPEAGDSGRRGPPLPAERWLRLEVRVPSSLTAPRPSAYCLPREPDMPEEAIERGITGRVEVSYEVDADGVAGSIATAPGSPEILSHAVRRWLTGCLFEPARQDGRRTSARVRQAFLFRIQDAR